MSDDPVIDATPVQVVSCDALPEGEFYLVDEPDFGGRVYAWRQGKAVELHGAEKQRVLRWYARRTT